MEDGHSVTYTSHSQCEAQVKYINIMYCYGSSHKSIPRVLVPLIQVENYLEVFRYVYSDDQC